jgi:small subunit ribosomal protein S1
MTSQSDTPSDPAASAPVSPASVPSAPADAAPADAVAADAAAAPTPPGDQWAEGPGAGGAARIKIGTQRPAAARVKNLANRVIVEQRGPQQKTPVPNRRADLPPELEAEIAEALGGTSISEVMDIATPISGSAGALEADPEKRRTGRVIKVHRGDVFVDLGGPDQGVLPLAQFREPPLPGAAVEVQVAKFDAEEGLYRLTMPNAAVDVGDWASVNEGQVIEVRISGHNKGGLECEAGTLRGFIPAGQVAIYRVEDFSVFVGEKWACLVTEVNPERKRLVLSRRSVLEREKADAKERLMGELAVGDVREGTVTRIQDFGAFVDLGGVDGLLHVSQLAWQRVRHPSEILSVGQKVKVKVTKMDAETGKIGLSLRDLMADPWAAVSHKHKQGDIVRGPVTRVLDKIGALVEIEPGIEGMIHISELSHQRAWRVEDFVQVDQEIEAKILSIDLDQKRISLSLKALMARPEPKKKENEKPEEPEAPPAPLPPTPKKLKGGTGGKSSGAQFGLKW